ncbi:MAG: indole-3-glycerol phosphate synthase TrpC [Phycisphaerae bacterium]|nr:indole-3-glycerol phosphate synthase TrpC [Phycisphaerae bacterium]
MPQNILDKILQTKRKEVQALRAGVDLAKLKADAAAADRARNFFTAVTKPPRRLANLIAEVKRASPSAGVICEDFDPPVIARRYALAGADAISVLTDAEYFQGSLEDLRAVREAVDLPILRKDFIIDPYQVYESRAAGADAILLIAAAVPPGTLMDLMILAAELRMTALVEVHGADELLTVRSMIGVPHAAYSVLGINNRDLTTFKVDINNTIRLAELAEEVPLLSESGIKTRRDVERLRAVGVKAVLIGETLMCSGDVAAEVENLLGPAT